MKKIKGDKTKCLGGTTLAKNELLELAKRDRIIVESDGSEHDFQNLEEPRG